MLKNAKWKDVSVLKSVLIKTKSPRDVVEVTFLLVPAAGVEPATFRSGGERSNPLSYAGNACLPEKITQQRSACHALVQIKRQEAKSGRQLSADFADYTDSIRGLLRFDRKRKRS